MLREDLLQPDALVPRLDEVPLEAGAPRGIGRHVDHLGQRLGDLPLGIVDGLEAVDEQVQYSIEPDPR